MFRGDHPDLARAVGRAFRLARDAGSNRVGSEHLLLSLTAAGRVSTVLGAARVTFEAVRHAVHTCGPGGAGAAADRAALAVLGVDLDHLLDRCGLALLDQPPLREPLLPFGARQARRRCAALDPPLGLDAQAAYEASLRLALARRERDHRPEHLAQTLVAIDPGVSWLLAELGVDRATLAYALITAFPPPRRNLILRADRRWGRHARTRDLVRRYERATGRTASAEAFRKVLSAS
ncbi:MAG: peptidase [Hamadaea sp.]|uniref:Clp protease N-terminal domain-containing protein n=1 Tax=Hamadaea sp. TaxID=2024425 RepID=UPI00183F1122|nr:Clp protease N-terminal domain-containing protein [Hamadaea sp.]NUR72351.1 peptidase [Hamadaea sp.]NUT20252.1 peptidase [Hamadaea sp.]